MRNLRSVKNYTDTGVTTTTDTGLGFTQFYRDRLFVVIFQGLNCVPQNTLFVREIHFFVRENIFSVRKKLFGARNSYFCRIRADPR
jgi:hypothetical protein